MSTSRRNSWSERLGKAVKRSSSLLSKSRRSSINQGSDSGSITKVNAPSRLLTEPTILPAASGPSPIAESPAREAAMTNSIPVGPSPLTQPTTEGDNPAQSADEVISIPTTTEYAPFVIDSSTRSPGAFTNDPEELPPTEFVNSPYAPTGPTTAIEGPQQEHQPDHAAPAVYQEADNASLSKVNDALRLLAPPAIPLSASSPSPPAESPARQAATGDSTSVGPPLLTQPTTEGDKSAHTAEEVVFIPAESEYISRPAIDHSVGNSGSFTNNPDELPPTELIDNSYAPSTRPASAIKEPQDRQPAHVEPTIEAPQHKSVEAAVQLPEQQQESMKVAVESPYHGYVDATVEAAQQEEGTVKTAVEVPQMEESVSLLDKSIMESIHDFELVERATLDFVQIVRENTASSSVITPSHVERAYAQGLESGDSDVPEYSQGKFKFEHPPSSVHGQQEVAAPKRVESQGKFKFEHPPSSVHEQQEVAAPKWVESHHEPEHSYILPSYSGQEVWGDIPVVDDHKASGTAPIPVPLPSHEANDSVHASYITRTSSIRNELAEDPFVDPPPKIADDHSDAPHRSHPEVAAPEIQIPEKDQTGYSTDKGKNGVEEDPHPTHNSLPSKVKAMALDAWDRAQAQFKAHPTWPIIGVGGAVAGMLATSLLLSRR